MQYLHLQMVKMYFVVVGKCFMMLPHIKIFETVQKLNSRIVSKDAAQWDYYTLIPQAHFFIHFVELLPLLWIGNG